MDHTRSTTWADPQITLVRTHGLTGLEVLEAIVAASGELLAAAGRLLAHATATCAIFPRG